MFSIYILYSQSADRYYVGHTDNLDARLISHNSTDCSSGQFTRKNEPWILVYRESSFPSRALAMAREKEIKKWKAEQ